MKTGDNKSPVLFLTTFWFLRRELVKRFVPVREIRGKDFGRSANYGKTPLI